VIRHNVQKLLLKYSQQGDMDHHFQQQRERREKTSFRPEWAVSWNYKNL